MAFLRPPLQKAQKAQKVGQLPEFSNLLQLTVRLLLAWGKHNAIKIQAIAVYRE